MSNQVIYVAIYIIHVVIYVIIHFYCRLNISQEAFFNKVGGRLGVVSKSPFDLLQTTLLRTKENMLNKVTCLNLSKHTCTYMYCMSYKSPSSFSSSSSFPSPPLFRIELDNLY
jgi:hypothetical protein